MAQRKLATMKGFANYFFFGVVIPEMFLPPEALCLAFLKSLDFHVFKKFIVGV